MSAARSLIQMPKGKDTQYSFFHLAAEKRLIHLFPCGCHTKAGEGSIPRNLISL
jgi:hypothetical protein